MSYEDSTPARVLVVLPMYGGSLPIGQYCVSALRELGHTVETFEAPQFYSAFEGLKTIKAGTERLEQLESGFLNVVSQAIYAQVERFQPDMVLAMAQAPLTPQVLKRLQHDNVLTAMWFVEDYQVFTYWRAFAPLYDLFFVIQKEPFASELRQLGVRSAYLPMAALPSFHSPLNLSPLERRRYGSTLSFVGAGYPNRRTAFRQLMHMDFKIWGSDWENETVLARHIQNHGARVAPEDAVKIFNASIINLNLHSSVKADTLVSYGDFVNPRTFELAACGAFQLVDDRTLLAELFAPAEMATFHSMSDLLESLGHYLQATEERETMAALACARVLKEHTYLNRMQVMLGHARDFRAEQQRPFPAARDAEALSDMLAALPTPLDEAATAELTGLLERLQVPLSASFEDVIMRLRGQSGELSGLETSLLFLDEWRKQYKGMA